MQGGAWQESDFLMQFKGECCLRPCLFVGTSAIAQLVEFKPDDWMAHEGFSRDPFC